MVLKSEFMNTTDIQKINSTDLSFEDALKHLENIVENLEKPDLSIEESIKNIDYGRQFSKFCFNKLHDLEKKIEFLSFEN